MRPVHARDAAQVAALLDEAAALHARLQPRFFRHVPGARKAVAVDPDEVLLVADDGARVVGLAHVRIYDTPSQPHLEPARRAYLDELIVTAAARRSGCGRALVQAASSWARLRGARQLLLTVWEGNRAATRFYAALGFARVSQVLGTEL